MFSCCHHAGALGHALQGRAAYAMCFFSWIFQPDL